MSASTTRIRRSAAQATRKAEVVSLDTLRRRREDRAHARAIALHDGAVALARMEHPELVELLAKTFGDDWLEERIRCASEPKRRH